MWILFFAMSLLGLSIADVRAGVEPGRYAIAEDASDGILNMRSGPGQGHPVVVSIPAGADGIVIDQCRRPDDGRSRFDWCHATWNGRSGWISSCCLVRKSAAVEPQRQSCEHDLQKSNEEIRQIESQSLSPCDRALLLSAWEMRRLQMEVCAYDSQRFSDRSDAEFHRSIRSDALRNTREMIRARIKPYLDQCR
jgi:hypothetical protein